MVTELQKTNTQLTGGLKLQDQLLKELDTAAENFGQEFTEYGRQCVINAISALVIYCKDKNIDLKELDATLLRLALQNVGYTELNFSAIPSECYFDIRKVYKDKQFAGYTLSIKPQGAGNEKLTRKYGVDLKALGSALLIREGDTFKLPGFDGFNRTPFTWEPKSLDAKVIMVVYPIKKLDDSIDYLIATRESVKANIIAHIRQNALKEEKRDELYARLDAFAENHSVDELLAAPDFRDWINPTYISGSSKEQMLLRKMKNNALKNYPKEYANAYMKNAVESMFEDVDESLNEKPKNVIDGDIVEEVEKDISEKPKGDSVHDFEVEEEENKEVEEKATPKEEEKPNDKDYGF